MLRRPISLALEGGGAKGFLYTGAIRALQERRKDLKIANIAGSSAGSLIALLIGMDVPCKEVEALVTGESQLGSMEEIQDQLPIAKRKAAFERHYSYLDNYVGEEADKRLSFFKEKAFDWFIWPAFESLLRKMGGQMTKNLGVNDDQFLYEVLLNGELVYGQALVDLLERVLDHYAGNKEITLAQFKEKFGVNLIVTGTDISSQILRIFSSKTSPDLPVKFACRMSSGIPFYFPVIHWQPGWGKYLDQDITMNRIVDGGILLNLPTWLLSSSKAFRHKYIGEQIDQENIISFLLDEHPDKKNVQISSKVPKFPAFQQCLQKKQVELKDDYLAAVRKDKNFNGLDDKEPADLTFKNVAKSVPGIMLLNDLLKTKQHSLEALPVQAHSEDILKLNAKNIGTVNFALQGVDNKKRMEEAYEASQKFLAEQFK